MNIILLRGKIDKTCHRPIRQRVINFTRPSHRLEGERKDFITQKYYTHHIFLFLFLLSFWTGLVKEMNGSGAGGASAIFENLFIPFFSSFFLFCLKNIYRYLWDIDGSGHQWIEDVDKHFPNEWENLFCLPLLPRQKCSSIKWTC